jgi:hypothetical protein
MDNITRCNASTKPEQNGTPVNTAFTFNWDNVTPEEIRAMAQSGLVIKMQSAFRRDATKNGTAIPTTCDVNVADHKPGTRAVRVTKSLDAQIAELSDDQRAALLARLMGE